MDIDTALLRTFAILAETRSFSLTAARVGRTQSAVSDQIKRLEQWSGVSLFSRTTRNVALTSHGVTFLRLAQDTLLSVDTLAGKAESGDISGEIAFGAPEDFATRYLPPIINGFAQSHPNVQLHVSCELTIDLVEKFKRGLFDLIVIKTTPGQHISGVEPLWQEQLVWAGHKTSQSSFKKLCGELTKPFPLVSAPPPCVYRNRATRALDAAGIAWSNDYVSPSFAGALAALRADLGFMVMPKMMVPRDLATLKPEKGWPPLETAEICLMGHTNPTGRARAFADFIRNNASRIRKSRNA